MAAYRRKGLDGPVPWAGHTDQNVPQNGDDRAPLLVVDVQGERKTITDAGLIIGKMPKTQELKDPIKLEYPEDEHMSRSHALFQYDSAARGWTVKDLGSLNGTFVNASRLSASKEASQPRVLKKGDDIECGMQKFKVLDISGASGGRNGAGLAVKGSKDAAVGAGGRRAGGGYGQAGAAAGKAQAKEKQKGGSPSKDPLARAGSDNTAQNAKADSKVYPGDKVKLPTQNNRTGKVLYVGPARFANGDTVCGIHLDEKRTSSDCDGSYKGERYFRCEPWFGLYCAIEDVEVLPQENGPQPRDANDPLDLEKELGKVVGMEDVKKMLFSVRNSVEVQAKRKDMGVKEDMCLHMLLLGNPGTGKTMVARMISRMLFDMGVLKKGHLVEVTRKDLVGQYSGETAKLTAAAVEKAVGGVLFIDEAYALKNEGSSDSHGQEAINTLIKELEDKGNDLLVMLAGYGKEMAAFLNSNPGLASRFPVTFDFPDYSAPEMALIAMQIVEEKGFKLDEEFDVKEEKGFKISAKMAELIKSKITASEAAKGNGRAVRTFVESAIKRQTDRVFKNGTVSHGLVTLLVEDFTGDADESNQVMTPEQVLARLDGIVGLAEVKEYIHSLRAQLVLARERKEAGLSSQGSATLHMIFAGNPGTGKTTVARVVADLLSSLGILRRGHLVEADRSCLVAGYSGQTAIKTRAVVESAMGGVLFVDEAYALVKDDKDQFGREALDTLVKLIEDHRDDLVVIFAGYVGDMQELLSHNPGVRSRFPTVINFPDYSAPELMQIAEQGLGKEDLLLSSEAKEGLSTKFEDMARKHDKENGNGRAVRNLIEQAKRQQALRLIAIKGKKEKSDLQTLVGADFGITAPTTE